MRYGPGNGAETKARNRVKWRKVHDHEREETGQRIDSGITGLGPLGDPGLRRRRPDLNSRPHTHHGADHRAGGYSHTAAANTGSDTGGNTHSSANSVAGLLLDHRRPLSACPECPGRIWNHRAQRGSRRRSGNRMVRGIRLRRQGRRRQGDSPDGLRSRLYLEAVHLSRHHAAGGRRQDRY